MTIDINAAIAADILTAEQAAAIGGAIIDHGGAFELRRENLTDDELEALDRLVIWLDHCEVCGQ